MHQLVAQFGLLLRNPLLHRLWVEVRELEPPAVAAARRVDLLPRAETRHNTRDKNGENPI
jgi:hypothetical protein